MGWAAQVGLTAGAFTPWQSEKKVVTCAGAVSDRFAEAAARVLPEMAGWRVAETTVQRTAEAVGERLGTHLRGGRTFGFFKAWEWQRDAARPHFAASISLDLTGVRQQAAADGGKAEAPDALGGHANLQSGAGGYARVVVRTDRHQGRRRKLRYFWRAYTIWDVNWDYNCANKPAKWG